MKEIDYLHIVQTLDYVHKKLAQLTLDQISGGSTGKTFSDIVPSDSILLSQTLLSDLRSMADTETDTRLKDMMERVWFACLDLAIEAENSSLTDMFKFYMEKGRMIVQGQKIPALEIVPWLQQQDDFELREEMRKEIGIFSRAILNPILLSILDLTIRIVREKFGYEGYVSFIENKRNCSFDDWQNVFLKFLSDTDSTYFNKTRPWVEKQLGHSLEDLNRCHALRLLRISAFDKYFPEHLLMETIQNTFFGLGLDLTRQKDIIIDLDVAPVKNPNAMCVPINLPGEIHVVLKPIGGLIDLEALLHEMGHAFFLQGFSVDSPIEYRRLFRSAALDESFAFLFMQLVENPTWLRDVAKVEASDADRLSDVAKTKRLLLIRRHIGKFIAEKEFFESGVFKDSTYYCNWLHRSTGFNYEPDGYLIDMDQDFYSAEYVWAWAGADLIQRHLYHEFGVDWFRKPEAGHFLRQISFECRKNSLKDTVEKFCGTTLKMPEFF
ncbi:MAG: hypothetical protein ACP5VS_01645 [Desulfomonilaceae bacterium]